MNPIPWYKRSEENRQKVNDGNRRWKKENPDKVRNYHFRTEYGIDAPPKIGVCHICRKETRLTVDHDHSTGVIRGFLCNPCNRGLGDFLDNPESLRRAIAYLAGPDWIR
jgi:hypothetical protein